MNVRMRLAGLLPVAGVLGAGLWLSSSGAESAIGTSCTGATCPRATAPTKPVKVGAITPPSQLAPALNPRSTEPATPPLSLEPVKPMLEQHFEAERGNVLSSADEGDRSGRRVAGGQARRKNPRATGAELSLRPRGARIAKASRANPEKPELVGGGERGPRHRSGLAERTALQVADFLARPHVRTCPR